MRKFLLLILTILMLAALSIDCFAQYNPISIKINGFVQNFNPAPIAVNGRILVPAEELLKALGAETELNENTNTVTASYKSKKVEIAAGLKTIKVNDMDQDMAVPAQIIEGKIMVPVVISEIFGAKVSWQGETNTVSVNTYSEDVIKIFPGPENLISPKAMAFDPDTGRIYAIVGKTKTLAVIDGLSGKIIDNIDLGYDEFVLFGDLYTNNRIMINPSNNTICVCPRDFGDTVIIDSITHQVIKRINAKGTACTYDPASNMLYTYEYNKKNSLSIIDVEKGDKVGEMPLSLGFDVNMAFNSSNGCIYLTNCKNVSIVDPIEKKLVKTFTYENIRPERIVFDDHYNKAYVIGTYGYILRIDADTGKELGRLQISFGSTIKDIITDTANGCIYAVDFKKLIAINCDSMTIAHEFPSRYNAGDSSMLAFDRQNNRIYLSTPGKSAIQAFTTKGGQITKVDTICLGCSPIDIAWNPKTHRMYAADAATDTIAVIDSDNGQVLKRIAIDGEPTAIAVNVKRNEVYYICDTGLYFIDGDEVKDRMEFKFFKPKYMTVDETSSCIYITDYYPDDGSVHVIDADSRKEIKRIRVDFPNGIAVNNKDNKIYVGHIGGGKVSPVITGFEITPTGTKQTISGYTPSGRPLGGEISVYQSDGEKIATLIPPDYAYGAPIVYDETQDRVFMAINYDTVYIVLIDATKDEILGNYKLSKELRDRAHGWNSSIFKDMVIDSKHGRLYISVQNDGIFIFDSETLNCSAIIDTAKGSYPSGLSLNIEDGGLCSANSGNGTISIYKF